MTTEMVVAALKDRPWGAELLVTGYFNVKLLVTKGDLRREEITTALDTEGLEDTLAHFLPLQRL